MEAIGHLKKDFNFGKWERLTKDQPLKYCGGQIYQTKFGVEVSYAEYMKLCPVTVNRGRKPEDEMSPSETSKYRALIGALQWPSSRGMPTLAASVSLQAGAVPKGTVQDINELNKTLRFGKSQGDVTIKFLAAPSEVKSGTLNSLENLTLVCCADAGFGKGSHHRREVASSWPVTVQSMRARRFLQVRLDGGHSSFLVYAGAVLELNARRPRQP